MSDKHEAPVRELFIEELAEVQGGCNPLDQFELVELHTTHACCEEGPHTCC